MLLLLLEQGNSGDNAADSAKLAREIFKQLTSEDLYYLALHEGSKLADYEKRYSQIEGGSELDSELARTILRYANEGK